MFLYHNSEGSATGLWHTAGVVIGNTTGAPGQAYPRRSVAARTERIRRSYPCLPGTGVISTDGPAQTAPAF
jgi:hypothetical protein